MRKSRKMCKNICLWQSGAATGGGRGNGGHRGGAEVTGQVEVQLGVLLAQQCLLLGHPMAISISKKFLKREKILELHYRICKNKPL